MGWNARIKAVLIAFGIVGAAGSSADSGALIDFLRNELRGVREDIEAQQTAPDKGGMLSKGKDDYQEEIDQILDEAIAIVTPDSFPEWLDALTTVEDAISEAEAERADLLVKRLHARASDGVGMLDSLLGRDFERDSVEDIDARVASFDLTLETLREDRDTVIGGFADQLRADTGVSLSDEQAKIILYSVNGSQIVEARAVLMALVKVEADLADILATPVGASAQETYLGVASLTRLMQVRLLQRHLVRYDEEWLPQLAEMKQQAQALVVQSRRGLENATQDSVRSTYQANIRIQEMILGVIDRYATMLTGRKDATVAAISLAEERADAAINTLMTLDAASGLSNLIDLSTREFESLTSLELHEFQDLDPEQFEEMLDITRRLGS